MRIDKGLALLVSTAAIVSMGAVTNPSVAAEKSATCQTSDGDHNLNMSATYSLSSDGTKHVWNTIYGMIGGQDTGGKSNFESSVWQNSTTRVWDWPSADIYDKGEQYSKQIKTASGAYLRTSQAPTEYVKMKVHFDTVGTDPSCTAQFWL